MNNIQMDRLEAERREAEQRAYAAQRQMLAGSRQTPDYMAEVLNGNQVLGEQVQQPGVMRAIQAQGIAMNQLAAVTEELAKRLEPVLGVEPADKAGQVGGNTVATCQVAAMIASFATGTDRVTDVLRSLLRRLEV